jgi:hypothetical protein
MTPEQIERDTARHQQRLVETALPPSFLFPAKPVDLNNLRPVSRYRYSEDKRRHAERDKRRQDRREWLNARKGQEDATTGTRDGRPDDEEEPILHSLEQDLLENGKDLRDGAWWSPRVRSQSNKTYYIDRELDEKKPEKKKPEKQPTTLICKFQIRMPEVIYGSWPIDEPQRLPVYRAKQKTKRVKKPKAVVQVAPVQPVQPTEPGIQTIYADMVYSKDSVHPQNPSIPITYWIAYSGGQLIKATSAYDTVKIFLSDAKTIPGQVDLDRILVGYKMVHPDQYPRFLVATAEAIESAPSKPVVVAPVFINPNHQPAPTQTGPALKLPCCVPNCQGHATSKTPDGRFVCKDHTAVLNARVGKELDEVIEKAKSSANAGSEMSAIIAAWPSGS